MKARRLVLAVMMGLAILLSAGGARQVLASPPDIQTNRFDLTFVSGFWSDTCGFPVTRHTEGWVTIMTRLDNNNLVKEIDQFFRTDILSANGNSIRGETRNTDSGTWNPDGSVTFMSVGPQPMFVQPGGGPIWASSGRLIFYQSADGDVTLLSESGLDVGDPSAICAALAP
jgi:hypothetical protein